LIAIVIVVTLPVAFFGGGAPVVVVVVVPVPDPVVVVPPLEVVPPFDVELVVDFTPITTTFSKSPSWMTAAPEPFAFIDHSSSMSLSDGNFGDGCWSSAFGLKALRVK